MKFDVVIGNPPYEGKGSLTLHYDITEKLLSHYNEKMIIIMPHRIAYSTSNRFDKFKCKFTNVSELVEVNSASSFIGTCMPNTGIFVFENKKPDNIKIEWLNKSTQTISNWFNISPFSDYEKYFMNKLYNETPNYNGYKPIGKNKNWEENGEKTFDYFSKTHDFKKDDYFVLCSMANGAKLGQGIFLSSRDKKHIMNGLDELKEYCKEHNNITKVFVKFKTLNEAENYMNAVQRPLLRFGLAKLQDDQSMTSRVYKYIPNVNWDDEMTKTDEGILKMVGFSEKESTEFSEYTKTYIKNIDAKFSKKRKI